jgi:hypothetical protein
MTSSNEDQETNIDKTIPLVEDNTTTKYDKLVIVSLIISIWMLSCILLHSYWLKKDARVDYNKTITRLNTKKLELKIKEYVNALNGYKLGSKTTEQKRTMYTSLIKLLEAYDKCNYIRLNSQGSPFPFSEVMISCTLLLIISCIILISNLSNNPIAKQIQIQKLQKDIQGLGKTTEDDLKNKEIKKAVIKKLEEKLKDAKTNKDVKAIAQLEEELFKINMMRGGAKPNIQALKLAKIRANYNKISTRINFLKSDTTFNQVSLSFAIMMFSMYVGFKMFMSSYDYEDNLYSGRLFTKGKCYS